MIMAALAVCQQVPGVSAPGTCSEPARRASVDFTLPDLQGHEIALRAFRGKVVLINFWATWCAPCRVEIPGLIGLYGKYHDSGLAILGVSVDDPVAPLAPFVARLGITYPVLVAAARPDSLEAFGELAGFPTSVLLSRDGKICARYVGLADTAGLERRILSLL